MTNVKHHRLTEPTGAMLLAARKEKGWTLAQAADVIGCDLSHIWRLEHAQTAPSTALAVDIVFAYGLNQDQARTLMSESVPGVGKSKGSRKAKAKAAA